MKKSGVNSSGYGENNALLWHQLLLLYLMMAHKAKYVFAFHRRRFGVRHRVARTLFTIAAAAWLARVTDNDTPVLCCLSLRNRSSHPLLLRIRRSWHDGDDE